MIDALSSRYGWSKDYIENGLFWEDAWEFTIIASNFSAEERNAELKFQFMLHADKESASKWKDLPIPFPATNKKSTLKDILDDNTGVKQVKMLAPHIPIGHVPQEVMTKALKQTDSPNNEN